MTLKYLELVDDIPRRHLVDDNLWEKWVHYEPVILTVEELDIYENWNIEEVKSLVDKILYKYNWKNMSKKYKSSY